AKTGLLSKAMTAPDGMVRIPLNESSDPKSQINEYLDTYQGEGIQHIACFTDDIYETVEQMRQAGIQFLDTPDTYFDVVDQRIPDHGEDLERLRRNRILIDADPETKQRKLLQIFTQNALGPIFFEIIQRKGNEGFGEGNFQALFESIERDPMRRGVLSGRAPAGDGTGGARQAMADRNYMSGFGNAFATEAIPGTLPVGRNSPQKVAHGLYAEQLSGTAFTAPRGENRRSWLYRIRPAAMHGRFEPFAQPRLHERFGE